ncbi:TPA: hypothetical protein NNT21_004529, partial [Salmonella enterica]|nr:hypothetical protein [Salmonella enterica]
RNKAAIQRRQLLKMQVKHRQTVTVAHGVDNSKAVLILLIMYLFHKTTIKAASAVSNKVTAALGAVSKITNSKATNRAAHLLGVADNNRATNSKIMAVNLHGAAVKAMATHLHGVKANT